MPEKTLRRPCLTIFLWSGLPGTGYSVSTGKNNVPRFRELSAEVEYTNTFEGVTSLYHPNEIAADYLADLALWDCLIDKNKVPAEQKVATDRRLNPVRIWARQTFATE